MRLLSSAFLLLLAGCSNQSSTKLSYSGEFGLNFSTKLFKDTTIFTTGPQSISLKINSESSFLGQIIHHETEGLPQSYDLRDYPKHVLRLDTKKSPPIEFIEKFKRSSKVLDDTYDFNNILVEKHADFIVYRSCSNNDCFAFVVKNTLKDRIFSILSTGMNEDEFEKLIVENLYVK